MQKMQFIEWLFNLYTNSWNERNKQLKQEQYYKILDDRVDFDKLAKMITEENFSEFMPQPAWIKERLEKCFKQGSAQKWQNVKVYNPILKVTTNCDCFPLGTSIENMEKSYEKKFKCSGWIIEEVY